MFDSDFLNHISGWLNWLFTINPNEPLKAVAKVLPMAGTLVTIGTALATKTFPWLRAKIDSRRVSKSLGASIFTVGSIYRSIRYYIPPSCQSLDPAGNEESRLIHPVQNKLFATLDNVLDPSSKERYHFLLADSGMGKTSALINYYVRHLHRWRKGYKLAVVPLGIPDADDKIKAIEDKSNTVLFLDALDEDTLAMVDHVERIRMLLKDTHEFPRLLITCRTQFFNKDEEIPVGAGIIKIFDRPAGEPAEYNFIKIYLTPFTDKQVDKYLRVKYPLWRWRERRKARLIVKKIPQLTARPMLLAHIDSLLNSNRNFHYSFELYEEMVKGWIEREKGFVEESEQLRFFSEQLSVDLYVNRKARGGEFITKNVMKQLAQIWKVTINEDKLSGRGLLNRDAVGNFKFAHRSIMEYLFVDSYRKQGGYLPSINHPSRPVEWTDQMKTFHWEMLEAKGFTLIGQDGTGLELDIFLDSITSPEYRQAVIDTMQHRHTSPHIDWNKPTITRHLFLVLLSRLLAFEKYPPDIKLYLLNTRSKGFLTDNGFGMIGVEKVLRLEDYLLSKSANEWRVEGLTAFVPPFTALVNDYDLNQIPDHVCMLNGSFKLTGVRGHINSRPLDMLAARVGTDILIPISLDTTLVPHGLIVITAPRVRVYNLTHLKMLTTIFMPKIIRV